MKKPTRLLNRTVLPIGTALVTLALASICHAQQTWTAPVANEPALSPSPEKNDETRARVKDYAADEPVKWAAPIAVLHADAAPAFERAAAEVLASYLSRILDADIKAQTETELPADFSGPAIHVGFTKAARERGWEPSKLADGETAYEMTPDAAFIVGGGGRAPVEAVYRFLEEQAGVGFWSMWEEDVPRQDALSMKTGISRVQPAFAHRALAIGSRFEGPHAIKLRVAPAYYNAEPAGIPYLTQLGILPAPDLDGKSPVSVFTFMMDGALPRAVHTLGALVPRAIFASHPDWFATVGGKPTTTGHGLNMTNPQMRDYLLEIIKRKIDETQRLFKELGLPPAKFFSIDPEDNAPVSQDAETGAIIAREGPAGPLFDLVNWLAERLEESHPDMRLVTLAYQSSREPPRTIRPHKNVTVMFCTEELDVTKPIEAESNANVRRQIDRWAEMLAPGNLWVWHYGQSFAYGYPHNTSYGAGLGFPIPFEGPFAASARYYQSLGVSGVLCQMLGYDGFTFLDGLSERRAWLAARLMENPDQDLAALTRQFDAGYFGEAGEAAGEYFAFLGEHAGKSDAQVNFFSELSELTYLDLDFFLTAFPILDRAGTAAEASSNEVLPRRVRLLRLPADRALLYRWPHLVREWMARGNPAESFPFDREKVLARYDLTCQEQLALRERGQDGLEGLDLTRAKVVLDTERHAIEKNVYRDLPTPAHAEHLPMGEFEVIDARSMHFAAKEGKADVVEDEGAEGGYAIRLPFAQPAADTTTGQADTRNNSLDFLIDQGAEKPADAPQAGWGFRHLFGGGKGFTPLPEATLSRGSYEWIDLGELGVMGNSELYFGKDQEVRMGFPGIGSFRVWARVKGTPDALFINQVLLTKKINEKNE